MIPWETKNKVMKIENIIEDIKQDIIELKDRLEERVKQYNPDLNFSVTLPGIEELATIKSIALMIEEANTIYYLSVHVHTHNGNRVFENDPKKIIDNQLVPYHHRHPFQDSFVDLLRDIIKKNKHKRKSENKLHLPYNDIHEYVNSA
ncbi:MAG: hypothetical protein JWP81_1235 [Ferruginibacter sp.]|nr:hypothetical protein [Ferruginibacter sp.]